MCLCGFGAICPAQGTHTAAPDSISSNPDTYFPGTHSVAKGASSIVLGPAGYGSVPIAPGDVVLVIQMQGAQIDSANSSIYGNGFAATGSGYLSDGNLSVGVMEFAIAKDSVSLSGGALSLQGALVNGYVAAAAGNGSGQYTFQVIRVPQYFTVKLLGPVTAPAWNGATGGVVALEATGAVNLNGQSISAAGAGFRGGGGRSLGGGTGSATDYVTLSTNKANGSKGEGIAGTPRFINNNQVLLDNGSTAEGYPGGSYARGAPGTAGGGATDPTPGNNGQNAGGGGGGNGGGGGGGGNSWSSNLPTGGKSGSLFAQAAPSRLVMGGGGGAGDSNNGTGTPSGGIASSGAAGGGIVILIAGSVTGTGTIDVSGAGANNTVTGDGSGGGGAGGSALFYLYAGGGQSNVLINAAGGTGGSNQNGAKEELGPGGGGGGGVIFTNGTLQTASSSAGGAAGVSSSGNYGATAGLSGILSESITAPQLPPGSVVPTTLALTSIELTAQYENGPVAVTWEVTDESGVTGYIVERSTDGVTFTQAGTVPYKRAPGSGINDYTFTDNPGANASVLYYRVMQVSAGGMIPSNIAVVYLPSEAPSFKVAPIPIRSTATVSYTSRSDNAVQMRLVSMGGETVWSKQYPGATGPRTLMLDGLPLLATGIYVLQCFDGEDMHTVKVMIAQ